MDNCWPIYCFFMLISKIKQLMFNMLIWREVLLRENVASLMSFFKSVVGSRNEKYSATENVQCRIELQKGKN